MAAIVGKKLGMTRIFLEDGTAVPVTVIEAAPNRVTAIRKADRDGYDAVQLAAIPVAEDRVTKPEAGHLKKAGAAGMKTLVEFRGVEVSASKEVDAPAAADAEEGSGAEAGGGEQASSDGEAVKIGDDVTVTSFEPGQKVKVSAVSIGKGFQGTIKRHNFGRGPETHGSHNVRAPGSIGASADPARVFKGMRMPGQMGSRRVTQRGASVVEVDAERNLLLIRGSVPGGKNATVEVRSNG
ncbi:MAG TPA: 50S ribosomal protein L3 [Solirubrobacterales bacterium]|nr:50S ribosomal protein L3 [Solirubrobacterales bacterium]